MRNLTQYVLVVLSALSAVEVFAQTPAEPAKKMSRYEREHGGSGGVFRRDPNIWVCATAMTCKNCLCVTTIYTF